MKITACPFDGCKDLRAIGVKDSGAIECRHCRQIFIVRPHEEGTFHQWKILVFQNIMHAASECPMEFQQNLFGGGL
jgi:hypothetical protein